MTESVYSLCFMCSVRCPIRVEVENGQVKWVEGNPHVAGMEGSLCPKGAAGIAFQYDAQRVQSPMIREGARGAGQWRKASWDEALDYVADKLRAVIGSHGGHSVVLGERANLATPVSKTFLRAIGSPITLPTTPSAKARSTAPAAACSAIPTPRWAWTTRTPVTSCSMAATCSRPSR